MSKLRLPLLLVVVATAIAAAPGVASASVSASCTSNGSSVPCNDGVWRNQVTVTWTVVPNPAATDCGTETSPGRWEEDVAESSSAAGTTESCSDGTDSASVTERVDKSAPAFAGVAPDRPPDFGGWYNHPVTFSFAWDGGLSGLGSCQTSVPYSGASDTGLHVTSSCSDGAGNGAGPVSSPAFNYDAGPPTDVVGGTSRAPDHNGWFNHALTIAFTGSDPTSGVTCTSSTYSGPDSGAASVGGGCTNGAGLTTAGAPVAFKYDDGAPTVTGASADRPPDHDGWYNHAVTLAFHGTDGASGIAGCTTTSYSGPDDSTASIKGSCTDVAGNSASKTATIKYDDHPPDKSKLYTVPANKSIDLSWVPPSDGASYTITRTPAVGPAAPIAVYSGSAKHFVDTGLENGKKYNYLLTTFDAAGNSSTVGKRAVPDGSSLRPFIDTEVSRPPRLTWKKVRRARYYNVQLFKGRKKILSPWPKKANFQLKSSWKYNGKKYKLTPGLYRWYVWPGIGSTKRQKYGSLVGSSTFRFVR